MSKGGSLDLDSIVTRLEGESEIRKVMAKYCRGTDRMDIDMLRSCFHPDATVSGMHDGKLDQFFVFLVSDRRPPYVSTTHFIGNQLIEIEGDTAWVETYSYACHRLAGEDGKPDTDRIGHARYVDRFEKRDGQWRIAHHNMVVDSDRVAAVTDHWVPESQLTGRRGPDDPSYDR